MKPQSSKPDTSFHKTPAPDKAKSEVLSSTLIRDVDLAIDDDSEPDCDPYNATGQHVMLKLKNSPKE